METPGVAHVSRWHASPATEGTGAENGFVPPTGGLRFHTRGEQPELEWRLPSALATDVLALVRRRHGGACVRWARNGAPEAVYSAPLSRELEVVSFAR